MTLVRTYGQYLTDKGLPSSGSIHFNPRVIGPSIGAALPSSALTINLDQTGSFNVMLPATDELIGVQWTYEIRELVNGVTRFFDVDVPKNTSFGINVPTLVPSDLGGVTSVDGRMGVVTLNDIYQASNSNLTSLSTTTLPGSTISGISDVQNLTNKRITGRVTLIVSSANPVFNTDLCDVVAITALATSITNMTTNMTGTPVDRVDSLLFEITDAGSSETINWGSGFVPGPASLPLITTPNKTLWVSFIRAGSAWKCLSAVSDQ